MVKSYAAPGVTLAKTWKILRPLPGGRWIFSRLLGWIVPYTGGIKAKIMELRPGFSRVELADRRRIRNHLRSIHAVALVNLGEMTSGLALLVGLPQDTRGIVVGISIEYFKKARGRLIAESHCEIPNIMENTNHIIAAEIRDQEGDVVARTNVTWRLGPIENKSHD